MVFGRSKRKAAAAAGGVPAVPAAAPAPPAPSAQQLTNRHVRASERDISRAQREMERERVRLQQEEKSLQIEIKRLMKAGRKEEARMMAKNLVKNREYQSRMLVGKAQMGGVIGQIKNQAVTEKMGRIMGNVGGVMEKANKMTDSKTLMQMAMQYEKESDKMQMGAEMMDDTLESVLGGEGIEEESDEVLASVLDELGLEFSTKAGATPMQKPTAEAMAEEEAAILKRIGQL